MHHSNNILLLNPLASFGLSVHMFCVWLHGFSNFQRHTVLIGNSKLGVGLNGCLWFCVSPVVDW